MKRLLPPVLFLLSLIAMTVLHLFLPVIKVIPFPFKVLGIAPTLFGATFCIIGSQTFRKIKTNIHTFKEPGAFVTYGLFNITRNPMYLGFSITLFGAWFFFGTLSPLFAAIGFTIIADRWYIPFEEKMMAKKFGLAYLDYITRVPRWI